MKVNNLEIECTLRPSSIFSKKTQKYYPCADIEFPDGTICKVFDDRVLNSLLSSIYLNEEGGEAD